MFIPRHPVVENQFCIFGETSTTTGVGSVLAYAGSVCYLDSSAANQEAIVKIFTTAAADSAKTPFGFLMQKVKTDYHQVHPTGFVMPGDLGSSDAIAQPSYTAGSITGTKEVPVGVAHLGIWDTVHYTSADDTALAPSQALYVAANANLTVGTGYSKVTNYSAGANDALNYSNINATVVAYVVKGVSAAKATANKANTTLYPMRIKLIV